MRLFNDRETWGICLNINMDVKCLLGCKSFSDLVIE